MDRADSFAPDTDRGADGLARMQGRIADVGAGDGKVTEPLARLFADVVTTEASSGSTSTMVWSSVLGARK